MNAKNILNADILDIIFEKRNKTYGAYVLRKYYNQRLYKALGISFLIVAIISLFIFFQKNKITTVSKEIETMYASIPEIPKEEPKAAIPETPKPLPTPTTATAASKPVVVTGEGPIVFSEEAPKISPPNNNGPGILTGTDSSGGAKPVTLVTTGGGDITKPAINKNTPVDKPDIMPSYPGGIDALRKFLEKNLVPPAEMESGETISVKIKFIVGYDGKLRGFETIEDGGEIYNNEVIRVLKKMPAWIPGRSHGEDVSVYYVVPVKFTPQD